MRRTRSHIHSLTLLHEWWKQLKAKVPTDMRARALKDVEAHIFSTDRDLRLNGWTPPQGNAQ